VLAPEFLPTFLSLRLQTLFNVNRTTCMAHASIVKGSLWEGSVKFFGGISEPLLADEERVRRSRERIGTNKIASTRATSDPGSLTLTCGKGSERFSLSGRRWRL